MMEILIYILGIGLGVVAIIAFRLIRNESIEQKSNQETKDRAAEEIGAKLKLTQEELLKEKTEKQSIEDLLYKTKDEFEILKAKSNEFAQASKELAKVKEELEKIDEQSKRAILEKEKALTQFAGLQRELEQARKAKETLEQEVEKLKKTSIDPKLDERITTLEKENAQLKESNAALLKEKESIKNAPQASAQGAVDKEVQGEIDKLKQDNRQLQAKLIQYELGQKPADSTESPLVKENEELKNKLKLLREIHEGLQGQYDELSKQLESSFLQKLNEPPVSETKAPEKKETPSAQAQPKPQSAPKETPAPQQKSRPEEKLLDTLRSSENKSGEKPLNSLLDKIEQDAKKDKPSEGKPPEGKSE